MSTNVNKCLCGKTGLVLKDEEHEVGVCHCKTCQKWSGGPYMTIKQTTQLEIYGESEVSTYDSSEWAERGFCKHCGTHLFYRLKANSESHIPAGLIKENSQFVLDHEIFIDDKPSFYSFSQETEKFTGEQVAAMFAPPAD